LKEAHQYCACELSMKRCSYVKRTEY